MSELKGQKDSSDEQNKKLAEENQTTQQQLAELTNKIDQLESSLKSKEDEISNEKSAHEERTNKIAELEQQIKDLQMQHTIAEKQNVNMVKQLQAQIKALQAPPSPSISLNSSGSVPSTTQNYTRNSFIALIFGFIFRLVERYVLLAYGSPQRKQHWWRIQQSTSQTNLDCTVLLLLKLLLRSHQLSSIGLLQHPHRANRRTIRAHPRRRTVPVWWHL